MREGEKEKKRGEEKEIKISINRNTIACHIHAPLAAIGNSKSNVLLRTSYYHWATFSARSTTSDHVKHYPKNVITQVKTLTFFGFSAAESYISG